MNTTINNRLSNSSSEIVAATTNQTAIQEAKISSNFLGACAYRLGQALEVLTFTGVKNPLWKVQDNMSNKPGRVKYINKKTYLKGILPGTDTNKATLLEDKKLVRSLKSRVKPFHNQKAQLTDLINCSHHFAEFTDTDLTKEAVLEKARKVEHIQLTENTRKDVLSKLQPGDIMLFRCDPETFSIRKLFSSIFKGGKGQSPYGYLKSQWMASRGQGLSAPFLKGKKDRDISANIHVAIYMGEGRIAEASPDPSGHEVRITDIQADTFKLPKGGSYQVLRMQNKKLASRTVMNAYDLARPQDPLKTASPLHYNYLGSGLSIFGNGSTFGNSEKKRLIRMYEDFKTLSTDDFGKEYAFYCSEFAGFMVQLAAFELLLEEHGLKKEKDLKTFLTSPKRECDKCLVNNFWNQFQFKCDPRYVTPQKFRALANSNPLFKEVLSIQAPVQS